MTWRSARDRLASQPDTKLGFSLLGKTRHGVEVALIATRYLGAEFFVDL